MDARKRNIIIKCGIFAACVGALYVFGYAYFYVQARKPFSASEQTARIFIVEKGDGAREIGSKLERERLVANKLFFIFYVWQSKTTDALQAGRYVLSPAMSPARMAEIIVKGEVSRDLAVITIPEGFDMRLIEKRLRDAGLFLNEEKKISDFTARDFSGAHDFLSDVPQGAGLEGYLFPDTYYVERSAPLAQAIGRMLENFGKKFSADLRADARAQGKRIFEIVTMASLLQKEVITEDDMKIAAGVLWRRLAMGMPLQVDAAVAYATGRNTITREDLAIDSPYNTYRYKGLPAGPIANPGLQALRAALYPASSDYLFYLSKPDGETVFSKTLAEHNSAKAKYLK